MREWLIAITELAVVVIDALALLTVLAGTVIAFVSAVRALFIPADGRGPERRSIWLTYARWLVAALTFQLAADIIESSIMQTWEAIGRLAAIAAVRTFLDYFLERDMSDVRERIREKDGSAPSA